MIQDIQPHHYDNQYRQVPPDRECLALYYEERSVLMKRTAEGIEFPRFRDLERLNEEIYEDAVYLFSIDDERYYLVQEISRESGCHHRRDGRQQDPDVEICGKGV